MMCCFPFGFLHTTSLTHFDETALFQHIVKRFASELFARDPADQNPQSKSVYGSMAMWHSIPPPGHGGVKLQSGRTGGCFIAFPPAMKPGIEALTGGGVASVRAPRERQGRLPTPPRYNGQFDGVAFGRTYASGTSPRCGTAVPGSGGIRHRH
jgi:hypothetical protein